MNQLLPNKVVKAKRAVRRRRREMITSIKITRVLYKKIQELAKRMDRTQSWIMREAIESWVTFKSAELKHHGEQRAGGSNEALERQSSGQ